MMTARLVLLALLPIAAGFALTRRRRLDAIIGMASFSLLLASVFYLSHAPDVAITEAAVGAALVTFIYVLAIRKTGRLTVAASEVPGLFSRVGDRISGLEYDLLERLAARIGLDLAVRFVERDDVERAVLRGEADIGAGGIVLEACDERLLRTTAYLPTARFTITSRDLSATSSRPLPFRGFLSDAVDAVRRNDALHLSLDLARFLVLSRQDLSAYEVKKAEGDLSYTLVVSRSRSDVHRELEALIAELRSSGKLDGLAGRHFP
jgi:energy-converting hydrogenase B subunit D